MIGHEAVSLVQAFDGGIRRGGPVGRHERVRDGERRISGRTIHSESEASVFGGKH
jgi:hypothetical protein